MNWSWVTEKGESPTCIMKLQGFLPCTISNRVDYQCSQKTPGKDLHIRLKFRKFDFDSTFSIENAVSFFMEYKSVVIFSSSIFFNKPLILNIIYMYVELPSKFSQKIPSIMAYYSFDITGLHVLVLSNLKYL